MSHEFIVTSSQKGIFTDTTSCISNMMTHSPISTDPEIAMCSNVPVYTTAPNPVTLMSSDALIALFAYDKFDVTNLYTVTDKSETSLFPELL